MFLLKICLQSYKAFLLKESDIRKIEDEAGELWIDGYIENPNIESFELEPSVYQDGVFNSIFLSYSERRLAISNDALGQRPLYYSQVGDVLYVGSCFWDVAGALSKPRSCILNEEALECLLALRRIVPAHHTLHRDVFVLPAGSRITKLDGSELQISHVIGMQQEPNKAISVHDAAVELKANMIRGLSAVKEREKCEWFWFGNSGGLDSRVIPALAGEVGLGCKGFLVSGDRVRGLKNLSKLGSAKVAQIYGIENKFIDYASSKCSNAERIAEDLWANPFGPANYHKNPDFSDFRKCLVVNGGNSFLIANDSGSWKRYLNSCGGSLEGYMGDILIRGNRERNRLFDVAQAIMRKEIDGLIDMADDFSVCRTLHQKYLNKTSPMGAFESMNGVGDFHYLYYSGIGTLYRHWPKEIFFDRMVQKEFMRHFYPQLMNIADQSGNRPDRKRGKTKFGKMISIVRGNGLNYDRWIRSNWFKNFISDVNEFEFLKSSPRSKNILNMLGEFNSPQDNFDMVKVALVAGMIESGLSPKQLS